MLALELSSALGPMHSAVAVLKRAELPADCRKAAESLERQIGSLQRLADDVGTLNAHED